MYKEVRQYFERIARSQGGIKHTDSNHRFFPGSVTQFIAKLKDWKPEEKVLWLDYPERKPHGDLDDRRTLYIGAFAVFACYDTREQDFGNMYDLQEELDSICLQIVARMLRDQKLNLGGVFNPLPFERTPDYKQSIKFMRYLDKGSFQLNDADPSIFNNRIGTRVEFTLQTNSPVYDDLQWNFEA